MLIVQILTEEPPAPRRLNSRIPRDLETICLKCLQKEPARRYQTARELANDLNRFFNSEPIHARPVNRAERLWRWCRRNPQLAGLTAAVAVALIAGTGVSTYFAFEAERNTQQAIAALEETEREKQRAEQEKQRAEQEENRADARADEARTAQTRAEANARLAQQQKELARRNLYAAEMKLAQNAYADAHIGRVLELLERQRPQVGDEDIRGFEWNYMLGLCRTDLVTLGGHPGPVTCVAFSPDGKILASGSGDSLEPTIPAEVLLWDTRTWQLQAKLSGHRAVITSLAFSADGTMLATIAGREAVRLWDVRTGKLQAILEGGRAVGATVSSEV